MKPEIIEKIKEHYEHAKQKHPYFADKMTCDPMYHEFSWDEQLKRRRNWIACETRKRMVSTETVLLCEVTEMFAAIEHCKMKEAIEEAYDCIAVLLRIVDVLEGRQALGNPTKKEGK
jgi:NTP pyrophosphatase (non-canonical NTP hydrolase)